MPRTSSLVVLTALPNPAKARQIAELLLKKKLAACVNLIGPVQSFFWWERKIDRAREYLLLIKTKASAFDRLRRLLEKHHPYSVPEIVALSIQKGNPPYLEWLQASIR